MIYQGKKWFNSGSKMVRNEEVWWADEYKEVQEFKMTKGYKKFLAEKRKKAQEWELQVLKSKLEYQMKKYGQVDEIDFQEYIGKAKAYYGQ